MKIQSFLKKISNSIIAMIFTPKCPLCNKIIYKNQLLCEKCLKNLPLVKNTKPFIIGNATGEKPIKYTSAFYYIGDLRKAVLAFKYGYKKQYSDFFAMFIKKQCDICFENKKFDLICFVPTKPFENENYSPLDYLAIKLSKLYNMPKNSIYNIINKMKNIPKQHTLTYNKRKENVIGVFSIKDKYFELIKDKNILLLDDIATTGSTICQCSKILYSAGANQVFGLTIAKTSLRQNDFSKNKTL